MKEDKQKGVVTEVMPNNLYRVKFEKEDGVSFELICYLSGKMRVNKIHVLIGDMVQVILDPYKGKTTNRIVRRGD